jgi:phage terminase large subunit-like protein
MSYVPKQRAASAVLECLPAAAAILKAKQQKQQAERAQLEARYDWQQHARHSQLAPEGDWQTLVWLAGRGWGKNRAASEWVRYRVEHCDKHRIALVAATAADVRDTVVEGESGILAVCPPWNRPTYQPSKRRVIWPNGAIGTLYSADEPERLRGPQHDDAFCDELASWRYPEAFDQLQFGLRLGADPRCVVTTTPKPVSLLKRILSLSSTLVIKGTTYENLDNLAPSYVDRIVKPYEGTRLGRQELNAELLDDNPDALWKREWLDEDRVLKHPDLKRVAVAVDPPATSGEGAAECGIVVIGLGSDGHGYVLDDRSIRGASPALWAREAVSAYHLYDANCIVAEVNNGGEMVEHTLRSVDPGVPIESVRASRGKYTRAEPISAIYEQHRIHHVGTFADLEDQMCSWMPGDNSPDRMDALVWACTFLFPNEGSNIIPFIAPVAPLRRDRSLGSMA